MLIRSQDKTTLIFLDRVSAIAKSKDNHIVVTDSLMPRPSEILDIAKYSSEAKAIKVLDEIQESSNYCEFIKIAEQGVRQMDFTYQMPADVKVEGEK